MFIVPIAMEKFLHLLPKGGRVAVDHPSLSAALLSILEPEVLVDLGKGERPEASSCTILCLTAAAEAEKQLYMLADDGFLILCLGEGQIEAPSLENLQKDQGFVLLAIAQEPSVGMIMHRNSASSVAKNLADRIAYNVPRVVEIRDCPAGSFTMKQWVATDGSHRIVPTVRASS